MSYKISAKFRTLEVITISVFVTLGSLFAYTQVLGSTTGTITTGTSNACIMPKVNSPISNQEASDYFDLNITNINVYKSTDTYNQASANPYPSNVIYGLYDSAGISKLYGNIQVYDDNLDGIGSINARINTIELPNGIYNLRYHVRYFCLNTTSMITYFDWPSTDVLVPIKVNHWTATQTPTTTTNQTPTSSSGDGASGSTASSSTSTSSSTNFATTPTASGTTKDNYYMVPISNTVEYATGTKATNSTGSQSENPVQIISSDSPTELNLPEDLKMAPVSDKMETKNVEINKDNGTLTLSGVADPNTTIYLYIFSEPTVVSVKTDSNGNWTYNLDKKLASGKHEVYVAVKDDAGNIKTKSNPIVFILGGKAYAADTEGAPKQDTKKNQPLLYYIVFAISIVSIIVSALFYILAKKHIKKHANTTS